MLRYISVKNFAIIENIEVEFNSGMTALTGETGAGKSLLIDAIGLLLGDRATSNIVRTGEQKAEVEGVFQYSSKKIKDLLDSFGVDEEDNTLIIRRQITPSNNNLIKVNGKTVTLSQLREITVHLADIHTQHDTHRLINTETYLDIIDGFHEEETEVLLEDYRQALNMYRNELKELKRLEDSNDDLLERLDLMKFQKEELESLHLSEEEELDLKEQIDTMSNYDSIYNSLKDAMQLLEQSNAIDRLYDTSKVLEDITSYNDKYKQIQTRFNEGYFELQDAFDELQKEMGSLDFDPRLLDQYETRLNELDSIKRKYRKSIPDLLEYLEQITKDIDNVEHYDDVIKDQVKKVEKAFETTLDKALKLRERRQVTSLFIEEKLISILDELELKKAQFKIDFMQEVVHDFRQSSQFHDNGIDEVDFLITTNVGEPLKSLSKSASGGEMSRIMLGLKNLLVQSLSLSLIIFDEIDTGVSGYVASQVAKKMKSIASSTQVVCITHIPQVAALSDHHLRLSKQVENGRTKAQIELLVDEKRVYEIATMISSDKVTEAALASAKELLQ